MQQLLLNISGLRTNPSQLRVKPGSLDIADNININAPNIAECRRGYKKYSNQLTLTSGKKITNFYTYDDKIHVVYGDHIAYDDGAGTFTTYAGEWDPASTELGMRSEQMNKAIFFATDTGVKRLDTVGGTIKNAGGPRGITLTGAVTGASGWMTNNTQVAYRVVWGFEDENGFLIDGAPSERLEVTNSAGGTRNVALTIYIPDNVTTDYKYYLYRSVMSSGVNIVANDELALVKEGSPTAGDITNGYLTYTDILEEDLRGAFLYTNPSQPGGGIINQNNEPPFCKDMASFKNYMLFANTRQRHRLNLTMVDISGTDGFDVDDTITIGGVTYTAKAAEDSANGEFLLETGGGTEEANLDATVRSLVKTINVYASTTNFRAYYVSGYGDNVGQMLIERTDLSDTSLAVTVSAHGKAWQPVLPTSGTDVSTTAESGPHRVYVSKLLQPDAVPILNYLNCGEDDSEIVRIIPLRDAVFVFKDNGETYRIYGDTFNTFRVQLFDDTVKIYGGKTASVYNNQIYTFSDQGIVAISDSGINVKSWDIEDQVIQFLSPTENPTFTSDAYGFGYETDRKYIFSDGTNCWCYNSFTNTWTKWTITMTAAFINPADDKIYWGDSNGYIYRERKNYTKFDYADDEFDISVISHDGYDVTVSSVSGITVGDTLYQGDNSFARITAIASGNILTVDKLISWDNSSGNTAQIYDPIDCKMRWVNITGDNPMTMKRFRELTIFFQDMNDVFDIDFANNFNGTYENVEIQPSFFGNGWGEFAWGSEPWGGADGGPMESRSYFPIQYQRALWAQIRISTNNCFTNFSLNGLGVTFEYMDSIFRTTNVST